MLDSFAGTVTIEWNGQWFPLPMNSLSAQFQELLINLLPKVLHTRSLQFDSQTCSYCQNQKLRRLNLPWLPRMLHWMQEHNWQATNGSLIKAKFISTIEGEDINLLMNQGRSEVDGSIIKLTKDSLALAQKAE